MSRSFDDLEYPDAPAPLPTDTLTESVVILLSLTVVQRVIGFVRAVLFCRWLDVEQLGIWDMAFSFLVLAAPLSVLAIPGAFGRYLEHYRQRGQLRTFLRWAMLACGGLALLAMLGILSARQWFSELVFGTQDQSDLVALAAACLMTVVAYNLLVEMFTALRNIRLVSVLQLVNSLAFAVLAIGLMLGWECSAKSVLLAYGGSCLIAILWAVPPLRHVWRATPPTADVAPQGSLWTRVVPFAAWVLLSSLLVNLFGVLDRYMIVHFSGMSATEALDTVGNYHSSRVVPLLLVSIASMLATMMMPHLSHDWEAGRREEVASRLRLLLKVFGFLLFAGAVAVLIGAPLLFEVAFRSKFPDGMAVLPWTLIYCTWFSLSLLVQNYLFCAEKARLLSVAMAAGLALNVVLNLVLLPRLGLEGAVLSTVAANAISLGLICYFNRRLGFHLDGGGHLILALPMALCLGRWIALLTLVLVLADAIWADRLLAPEEKQRLAERIGQYGKRFGLDRRLAGWGRHSTGR
jgi:O-antigen/teichoic acid export membrane protein